MGKSKSINGNLKFLNENNILPHFRKNGGNVVTVSYLGDTFYVGLDKFKFRLSETNNWVQKIQKVLGTEDIIPDFNNVPEPFIGMKVSEAIEKHPTTIKDFMINCPFLFSDECAEKLGNKDLEFSYAINFVMPFGKYQRLKLGKILSIDINYLRWMCQNFQDSPIIQSKAEIILRKTGNI